MIEDSFDRAIQRMKKQNWDKIYILIDVHDTIIKGTYSKDETYTFYPYSIECLKLMSPIKEISMILWTSSYEDKIKEYLQLFRKHEINFDMTNRNHEVDNEELTCFDSKTYFNVGIDDKFGFNANTDWESLYNYLMHQVKINNLTTE